MKAKKIISTVLIGLPLLMLTLSAVMKFIGAQQVVDGLTKVGFIPYFPLTALGAVELICVIAFIIPKTWRIGFFLVCGYLGGAASIEITTHQLPIALVLLTFVWMGVYLKESALFVGSEK